MRWLRKSKINAWSTCSAVGPTAPPCLPGSCVPRSKSRARCQRRTAAFFGMATNRAGDVVLPDQTGNGAWITGRGRNGREMDIARVFLGLAEALARWTSERRNPWQVWLANGPEIEETADCPDQQFPRSRSDVHGPPRAGLGMFGCWGFSVPSSRAPACCQPNPSRVQPACAGVARGRALPKAQPSQGSPAPWRFLPSAAGVGRAPAPGDCSHTEHKVGARRVTPPHALIPASPGAC